MTGRPARALGVPEPGTSPALSQALPPGSRLHSLSCDPLPQGLSTSAAGPVPRCYRCFLGLWVWDVWVVPGHPSRTSIPKPSMTRKVWVSYWPVTVSGSQWFSFRPFLVLFCLFFFKENETLYNKVDKFFFEIVTLTVNTVTFLEVWDLTLL